MKEKNGEHPFGDSGQLISLVLFLLIWVVDWFLLQISTFLSGSVSLYIRLVILGPILLIFYPTFNRISHRRQNPQPHSIYL
jgi:hypothetical protein